jgi:2,4-didehydro-3-deoxy-L-rhamnonate hydrolase
MRIANVGDRLKLLVSDGAVDVEQASAGRFAADPQAIYSDFGGLSAWAATIEVPTEAFEPAKTGPPVPAPRQTFAIGLNYVEHAAEAGQAAPASPVVFTKFVSSLTGPVSSVELPAGSVDWEVELVAVIGKVARHVPVARGWDYVAGLTAGQDISERALQMSGGIPQWSMAKSLPGFSPIGPVLVTPDELPDPDDIAIGCAINGETVQESRTSLMIFSVPKLVAYLSSLVTLLPGDLIWTGTPSGIGAARTPPRYLQDGDELHSWVDGIGTLDQRFVSQVES